MQLIKGRPADLQNRSDREIRVYELLDKLDIEYERVDHEAAYNMEACLAVDEVLGTTMCKNLFLCNRQKTQFYLLLMPGDKPFKTKDISAQINSARLSFGEASYMEEYLDILPGAVSVLGLMNDTQNRVQLLIDKPVLEKDTLGCHPCVNTSSLKLSTQDILRKFLPAVGHEAIIVDLPVYSQTEEL